MGAATALMLAGASLHADAPAAFLGRDKPLDALRTVHGTLNAALS